MPPFFETITSFTEVDTTEGIETVKFLDACDGVVELFKRLNSAAFTPVQSDIAGNIDKVRTRYNAEPALCGTLEQLVENEKTVKGRPATEGLMWLLRGLSFTCKGLQNAQAKPQEELSAAFSGAYDLTLKKFHGFLVKGVFALAMKACPTRLTLYTNLAKNVDENGDPAGEDAPQEKVIEEMDKWLAALSAIVLHMENFYEDGKHNDPKNFKK
ncbi:Het-c2 protein [Mycena kentingensis (nom. inval.)]|nr:Het-c2 protein [Mycena kentingensis (nom. inval.)]